MAGSELINQKIKFQMYKIKNESLKVDGLFEKAFESGVLGISEDKKYCVDKYEVADINDYIVRKIKLGRIVNMRDTNIPRIVKVDKSNRDIDLSEDEYLGEDTHFLIDLDNNIIFLQKSFYSIGVSDISNILSLFLNDESLKGLYDSEGEDDYKVVIDPIASREGVELLGSRDIKYLEINIPKISDIDLSNGDSSLKEIIEIAEEMESESIKLTFSVGRARYVDGKKKILRKLSDKFLERLKPEISQNRKLIKGKLKEQIKGAELLDLFDAVEHYYINFEMAKRDSLPFPQVIEKVYSKYKEIYK